MRASIRLACIFLMILCAILGLRAQIRIATPAELQGPQRARRRRKSELISIMQAWLSC